MKFIADLHIHSRFSIATSSQLTPPMLDLWGRKKGVGVVGTGDATHPGWFAELENSLVPLGNGLFRLKPSLRHKEAASYGSEPVSFILSSEISCIYKRDGKVRKVHNLVFAPRISDFTKIQCELEKVGNIRSDGRPILGLDSRDLLEIVLNVNEDAFLVPAHIWTPWFSVLGSKSGFDTIEECYGDLSEYIFAVETGLSSDPAMNAKCSFLDRYALVSNSDAHSPENLGREANLFDTEMSYESIVKALKGKNKGFLGTIEYFPEEGKYHLDGHRKCGICLEPHETKRLKGICSVCGKPLTLGVLNRVMQLADRKENGGARNKFHSMTPLRNVLSEMLGVKPGSKKVTEQYEKLLKALGPELEILIEVPLEEISTVDTLLSEGIGNLRSGKVQLGGGYDGEYGCVRVFG
jgi:uncharacterized protein (TIGR00375 family)